MSEEQTDKQTDADTKATYSSNLFEVSSKKMNKQVAAN